MSERKVINKYYPPDWDPAKEEAEAAAKRKAKKRKAGSDGGGGPKVRMMLPMTVQCGDASCGSFLTAGTKLYARKEAAPEHKYLGKVAVHRFRMRCPACGHPFAIRTDPANAGYVCDDGCTRPYEALIQREGEAAKRLEEAREGRRREEGAREGGGRQNPLVWSRPSEGEAGGAALREAGEIERLRRQNETRGEVEKGVRDEAAVMSLLDRIHGRASGDGPAAQLPAPPPPPSEEGEDPFADVLGLMRATKARRDGARPL